MNCIDCKIEITNERAKNWEVCISCAKIREEKWIRGIPISENNTTA